MKKSPRESAITLAFDDAYLDTYKYAIKYLDRLNIKSTIAVPSSYIGRAFENRPLVGLKELRGLVKSGHEVASHTITHPNLLRLSAEDKDAVIAEIAGSKNALESLFGGPVSSFVFPYIKENRSRALGRTLKNYYKSARITLDAPCFNRIPPKDPHAIRGFCVMKKHSLSYLNKQVDYAVKNKRWLVEVFHLVGRKNTSSAHRPAPYRFFMHIEDFKKHIDYILSKDIPILTQRDAVGS